MAKRNSVDRYKSSVQERRRRQAPLLELVLRRLIELREAWCSTSLCRLTAAGLDEATLSSPCCVSRSVPSMPLSAATATPSPVTRSSDPPIDTMTDLELAVGASRTRSSCAVKMRGPKTLRKTTSAVKMTGKPIAAMSWDMATVLAKTNLQSQTGQADSDRPLD